MDLPGIADIPKKCLTDKLCDHPSIASITNHLKGRTIASDVTQLKQFRIGLYINNESSEKLDDIKIDVIKSSAVSFTGLQGSFNGKAILKDGKAFTIEGSTNLKGMQKVVLELKIKNKPTRLIPVKAEGGFSTIINVNLLN